MEAESSHYLEAATNREVPVLPSAEFAYGTPNFIIYAKKYISDKKLDMLFVAFTTD